MLTKIKKIVAPYCLYIMFVFGSLEASCETCLLGTITSEFVSVMWYYRKTSFYLTYVPLSCPKLKSHCFCCVSGFFKTKWIVLLHLFVIYSDDNFKEWMMKSKESFSFVLMQWEKKNVKWSHLIVALLMTSWFENSICHIPQSPCN